MKQPLPLASLPALLIAGVAGGVLIFSLPADARTNQFNLTRPVPGGILPLPRVESIMVSTQRTTVQWHGWQGPYEVLAADSLQSTNWMRVGTTWDTSLTVTSTNAQRFFKIHGGAPNYSGYPDTHGEPVCIDCHEMPASQFPGTAHAHALDSLKSIGMDQNPGCLPCHSVGFGLSSGFQVDSNTHLANVQCESCHGPAGNHAMAPSSQFPVVTYQSSLCAGCHTDAHHPTADEWRESRHGEVTEHVQEYFQDPNTGMARILACGPCHSGSVRLTMLSNYENRNLPHLKKAMPSGGLAAHIGIECVVCHDPHMNNPDPAYQPQLRNPKASLIPFNYNTATTTSFEEQYNPKVSICGQCHNARGAQWSDTSRPPHHSTQYNILTGTLGITDASVRNSMHRKLEKQCTACHMHKVEKAHPTEEDPNYTGHSFEADLASCVRCHAEETPETASRMQATVMDRLTEVKALLDTWGRTKAPVALAEKYKELAWEYNVAGGLSDPSGTKRGPTNAEQAAVPDEIKQARFNLYLVYHDGSFGIHNPTYVLGLIRVAEEKVRALLDAE